MPGLVVNAALAAVVASYGLSKFAPEFLVGSIPTTAVLTWFTTIIATLIFNIFVYPVAFSPLRHLPKPPGEHPILGQFLNFVKRPPGFWHRDWIQNVPNDGLIFYNVALNSSRVLVTTPQAAKQVLNDHCYDFSKPPILVEGMARILGRGLLVAEGGDHKMQRKNLTPAFSFRHIKELYPIFWTETRNMVNVIDRELKSSNVTDVASWASRSTLDMIGVAGLGQSFGAIESKNSKLYQVYQALTKPNFASRIVGLLTNFLPYWLVHALPLARNDTVMNAANEIKASCRAMIAEKKQRMDTKEDTDVDILNVALKSNVFEDENLVSQLMTFLAAGHETTAAAFSWAVLNLCKYPEVQTRLRAELDQVLPDIRDPSSNVDPELFEKKCPYLLAVCNETLRMMPPVPVASRIAIKDTNIAGQVLPKGTNVAISSFVYCYDPKQWGDDVNEFKPERWLGEGFGNGGAVSNYSMMPFLHGPRGCIGQGFARAELSVLVSAWCSAYKTELADPNDPVEPSGFGSGLTIRPKHGLNVKLERTTKA